MKRAISEQQKATRKQALLMAALDEFYEQGFTAARMNDIAARAKLSKGTLYLYFNSKQALFSELISAIAQPKVSQIEQILATQPSVNQALTTLFSVLPTIILQSNLPKIIKIIISDAFAFPEIVELYHQQIIQRALTAMSQLLARGCKSGELINIDPELTAKLVIAPVFMAIIWNIVFEPQPPKLNVAALLKQHQQLLFSALFSSKMS